MTLPSKEQFTGSGITEQGFKTAQNQLIDHIAEEIATNEFVNNGINNVNMMWFFDPYYEKNGNKLYFKPKGRNGGATDPCFYIRATKYPNFNISLQDFLAQLPSARFVTSPLGVTGCIEFIDDDVLYINHENNSFSFGSRYTLDVRPNSTILIHNNYDEIGRCTEESRIMYELSKNNINASEKTRDYNTNQMWLNDPYYEKNGNDLYFKLKTFENSGNAFYMRDNRYGNVSLSLASIDTSLLSTMPVGRNNVTSPLGVTGCYKITASEQIYFDFNAGNLVFGNRLRLGKNIVLIANNYTEVGRCIEEQRILYELSKRENEALEKKLTAQIVAGSVLDNRLDDTVKAVAHRGYSVEAPENTLPAYILAKKKGYSYAETDIQFTSDNIPVLLHDDTIDRTSNGAGNIAQMTFDQVRQYDFGSWFDPKFAGTKIPSLHEFLQLCHRLAIHPYLEIKKDKLITSAQSQLLADMVRNAGLKGKVTYISFSIESLTMIKEYDPFARLGYLEFPSVVNTNLAETLKTNTNEVFMDSEAVSVGADVANRILAKDMKLEVWTLNDASLVKKYVDMGVSGITTDVLNIRQILNEIDGV
ncbi:glycerophosphodiester phosphodiesterase [Acinetobacter wuhouensis]|uniref:GP-PDE domain-containing protein n=1 Tax=Acinetobacter wuhouensis TaxID=1879050 RepID=A0A4Q7AII1_9GAMM|nr:glycerophosphodiester phosphodiesterase family protein [Acinetobacter wuhouensis]RZG48060.1 hypothetical protein EXU28_04640 [Acinetobacter wuhouensis]